jgi:hypothetical protein
MPSKTLEWSAFTSAALQQWLHCSNARWPSALLIDTTAAAAAVLVCCIHCHACSAQLTEYLDKNVLLLEFDDHQTSIGSARHVAATCAVADEPAGYLANE